MYLLQFILLFLFVACSNEETGDNQKSVSETIQRHSNEIVAIPPAHPNPPPQYPWEEYHVSDLPKVTKEYFRCKGSLLNPEKMIERNGKPERITDCGGSEQHSLPLKDDKEHICPILITLLNYIQSKTEKRVVITSGHRCPEHNTYVDPSFQNTYSKHMVGAEVSFFVQGMENKPQEIVDLIFDYYENVSPYKDQSEFTTFLRYEKSDTNVSIKPWYNKEVFIKLFNEKEGRNFDNRHPFPYIAIQVRYDPESRERVTYSWEKAYKNYLRR